MAPQVGNPLAILDVRFVPWHGLQVLGVGQDHLAVPFQQVEHGTPKDAGRLHSHVRHALTAEPLAQRQQPCGGGGERAHLFGQTSTGGGEQQASDHCLLMHIQARAVAIQDG
jgi:hypothetical protein